MTTTNEVRFRCYGCGGWSTSAETCTACGKVAPPMSISRKVQGVKPIPATLPDEPCEKCASGYCCPLQRVTEQRDNAFRLLWELLTGERNTFDPNKAEHCLRASDQLVAEAQYFIVSIESEVNHEA